LRPKVSPPLSQKFLEEIVNQRVFVVVRPNESTTGPRFKNPWIFNMKRFKSWAKKKMNLISRFPSSIVTEIADSITPTLVRLLASLALKPRIATENNAKHSNIMSRVSERRKGVLVVIFMVLYGEEGQRSSGSRKFIGNVKS
jgi:hypothetical protein